MIIIVGWVHTPFRDPGRRGGGPRGGRSCGDDVGGERLGKWERWWGRAGNARAVARMGDREEIGRR